MSTDQLQPDEIAALVAHLQSDVPLSAEFKLSLAYKLQLLIPGPTVRMLSVYFSEFHEG
jgi:hypothetical protein